MMTRRFLLVPLLAGSFLLACAGAEVPSNQGGTGGGFAGMLGTGAGGAGNSFGNFGGGSGPLGCPGGTCKDFPAAPILDEGVTGDPSKDFGGAASGAGPCVMEPEDGTLFPRAWLRPRIRWTGGSGLHQITITTPKEDKPLVAYTTKDHWILPKDIWTALYTNVPNEDFTVTVRAKGGGATSVKFRIATVPAEGKMVFWSADPKPLGRDPKDAKPEDSDLQGFSVGDETTRLVLSIDKVKQPTTDNSGKGRTARCIGCHVATPDGQFVAFVDHWPWSLAIAGVKDNVLGAELPDLSPGGRAALRRPWSGTIAMSPLHWKTGDRIMVTASQLADGLMPWAQNNAAPAKLVWYNLDAPAPMMTSGDWLLTEMDRQYGVIARTGDPNHAANPTWGRVEDVIVYSSTPMGGNKDGRLDRGSVAGKTDLYQVPFGGGKGGEAKPVMGAADPAFEEYYPALSPDDKLIAYSRVPGGEVMYANPKAELYVVPRTGGAPVRLKANDPPACAPTKSPGVNNHWARWSPVVQFAGGGSIYWMVFSSNRAGIKGTTYDGKTVEISQLYATAVQVTENEVLTYPAIYLWNQPATRLNTTPAWEAFQIFVE